MTTPKKPAASATAATPPTVPSTTTPGSSPGGTGVGEVMFIDLPAPQFQAKADQVGNLLAQALALIVNPTQLTPDQRLHSSGKLRAGEAEALIAALDVAKAYPASFVSLATMDNGVDPSTFEADLVANRLRNAAALEPLVATMDDITHKLSDCMLALNDEARGPAKDVYALAKALAHSIPAVESMIASTVAYYARISHAAAASRAANKAAKDALAHGTGAATIVQPAPTAPKIT